MASFQKHKSKNGNISWRAQIFANGIRDSKSGFATKLDANLWATQREVELLNTPALTPPHSVTLSENSTALSW